MFRHRAIVTETVPHIPEHRAFGWRLQALFGGLGYVSVLAAAGLFADFSFASGPSLFASDLPVLVSSLVGMAFVGGFTTILTGIGFRSSASVVLVGSVLVLSVEASSLQPSIASLFGTWAMLAPLVVMAAGVEYVLRRDSSPNEERSVRRSSSTERALLGGALASLCLLAGFSLQGVGPVGMLSAAGQRPSASALASVFAVFGPPTLLVGVSITFLLRYGLFAPLISVPAVGVLLANPLGFAFGLFADVAPLVFLALAVLATGEYTIRGRASWLRPRSLVG